MNNCLAKSRDELGAAINCRSERERSAATANQAKQRAEALVEKARATLAKIDARSKDTARRRADAIKAGSIAGSSDNLHEARATAQANLDQSITALEFLAIENKDAERKLSASEAEVCDAVARVITMEAEVIADELIAHNERAVELRTLLLGLSYIGKGGPGNFVLLPTTARLSAALNWSEPQLPGNINPIKVSTASWIKYRDALAQRANAIFDDSRQPLLSTHTSSGHDRLLIAG